MLRSPYNLLKWGVKTLSVLNCTSVCAWGKVTEDTFNPEDDPVNLALIMDSVPQRGTKERALLDEFCRQDTRYELFIVPHHEIESEQPLVFDMRTSAPRRLEASEAKYFRETKRVLFSR